MANLGGFDASTVEPNAGFEPLPAGKYVCVVTDSEMKPTKAGHGEYLQLELEVVQGPYQGRKVWDRLVLKHPNPQTVQIARGTLSALCRAVGVLQPRDSVELHNLPVVVSVGCKKRDDTPGPAPGMGEITNTVKGYAKREAASAAPPPVAAPAGVSADAPGGLPGVPGLPGLPGVPGLPGAGAGAGAPPWKR